MPRQYWKKQVRIIKSNGRVNQDTRSRGLELIESGRAELIHTRPFTIRILDNAEYLEELRQQKGWITQITKRPGKTPFKRATVGNHSTRAKSPRHHIPQVERDFQAYKNQYQPPDGKQVAEQLMRERKTD